MKRTAEEQRYNHEKSMIGMTINRRARQVMPVPMPGRLPDGTPVWLHYEPLRWERYP